MTRQFIGKAALTSRRGSPPYTFRPLGHRYPVAVVQRAAVRRASYGPDSPVIGERGARTRARITDAALQLLHEQGAPLTTVDDIARAAGVSRATLYQYFGSKAEILVEVVEASGAAHLKVLQRLGPLGPTLEGLDSLKSLLNEWVSVYERYAPIFLQWALLDSPEAPLRPMLARWIGNYIGRMRRPLEIAGVSGADTGDLALALWTIFERYSFFLHRATAPNREAVGMAEVAKATQLILFPDTPLSVLESSDAHRRRSRPALQPPRHAVPAPERPDRFLRLGPVGRQTVERLAAAGRQVFAAVGFHSASVDQIITAAGVGRGTFYKYFDGKEDLLTVLSTACMADIEALALRLRDVRNGGELRDWMYSFVQLHSSQVGVFRVWTDGPPLDPQIRAYGRYAVSTVLSSAAVLLGRVERAYAFDIPGASLMFMGLLERYPGSATGTRYERGPEEVAAAMAAVVQRGFLNPGTHDADMSSNFPV